LIEGLVGVAMERIASDADLGFLEHAKLDARQLKKCLADLQALPPMPVMGDKVGLAERFTFLQSVILMDRDGLGMLEMLAGKGESKMAGVPLPDVVNWDPVLRKGNQFYARLATTMRLKDRTLRERHLNEIELDIKTLVAERRGPAGIGKAILAGKNPPDVVAGYVGDVLLGLLIPAVTKVQHAADRAEQTQHNLHVAFALGAYQRDNGKYPRALDLLAPKYLASVPSDLFNGKALIYRPTEKGYLLYSVGLNAKDDAGRSYDDDPSGDDLVVRMPR
jgi:hypothetical protein